MAKVGPQGNDATAIYQSIVTWLPTFGAVMSAPRESVTASFDAGRTVWEMHFKVATRQRAVTTSIPFNPRGPRIVEGDQLLAWGVRRLGPGVWILSESIHVEGYYHGFVVLVDVPEPAPWNIAALEDVS